MRVGFTVVQQGEDIRFEHSLPQYQDRTNLVCIMQTRNAVAAFIGRLYYRYERLSELRSRLSEDSLRECTASDTILALSFYLEFGPDALERLEGDFALVVWDAAAKRLIGMRDPMGGYPLYWTQYGDTFAIGTGVAPLLKIRRERTLNREYLADFLMMSGPSEEGATQSCVYEGIYRVLPGMTITLDIQTLAIRKRVYWNWLERIQDPETEHLEEIAGLYANALRTAVRERLWGRTAAQLSGGMDSTSIALLARNLIREGVIQDPLHTLSLIYERLPQLAREKAYIEKALQQRQDIIVHRILADDLLHYDVFTKAPPHDEPYSGLWALQMALPMLSVAAEVGAVTLLTGHGADEIHDVQPYFLADLLRHGRIFKAWREAGHWAQARNNSRWEILKIFGLATMGWPWASGRLRRNAMRLKEQNEYSVSPWIVPAFAHDFDLHRRAEENFRQTYRQYPKTTLSVTIAGLTKRPGDFLRWNVAAPLGIVITHPFLDSRLLALGLGIQLRLQPDPYHKKPILAEAMRSILPKEIRERRTKGYFDEIYYLGLARNLPYLEAMVRNAPLESLGIFDKGILIKQLEEASLGGANCLQLHRLDITLSLIKWLCLQEEMQRDHPVSTESIQVWSKNHV